MELTTKKIVANPSMTDKQMMNCLEEIDDFFHDLKLKYDVMII